MSWRGYSQAFLDTAPLVYYVERNAMFFPRIEPIFAAIDAGELLGVTSPVTLSECLVMPFRKGNTQLASFFVELIVQGTGISFVSITSIIGERAAQLRAKYNLQLLDALQIATAIESGCDAFLTNDAVLKRVAEIPILMIADL